MKSIAINDKKHIEELNKTIENLCKLSHNKLCFDCGVMGTTYVVLEFGTFICSNCSGIHRELNYKVKGLGVSNFNDKEVEFLKKSGNEEARKIWLSNYDPIKNKIPDPKDSFSFKNFIKAKYEDKKFMNKQVKQKQKHFTNKEVSSSSDENSVESDNKSATKNKIAKLKPLLEKISQRGDNNSNDDQKRPLKKLNIQKVNKDVDVKHFNNINKNNINEMLENFEFFEDKITNSTSNKENIDISNLLNIKTFDDKALNENTYNKNNPIKIENSVNGNSLFNYQNKSQNITNDINLDQLYTQFNQSTIQYPGYQQQNNSMKPLFNNQMNPQSNFQFNSQIMNSQINPQLNSQMNPQMMNMIMSNPQLVYQLMKQVQKQQGIQSQYQTDLNSNVYTNDEGNNFQSLSTIQLDIKKKENDLFKDIYSYSENKNKNLATNINQSSKK